MTRAASSFLIPLTLLEKSQKMKTGRNDPCPCGSGMKFKKCCGRLEPAPAPDKSGSGPFRFQAASYGGPGRGHVPSVLCQRQVSEDEWQDYFVLANPTVQHEEPDAAITAAGADLEAAFAAKQAGGSDEEVVLSLRAKGYVNIIGFNIVKE